MHIEGTLGLVENMLQGSFRDKQENATVDKNRDMFRAWWKEYDPDDLAIRESRDIVNYGMAISLFYVLSSSCRSHRYDLIDD